MKAQNATTGGLFGISPQVTRPRLGISCRPFSCSFGACASLDSKLRRYLKKYPLNEPICADKGDGRRGRDRHEAAEGRDVVAQLDGAHAKHKDHQ